MHTLVHTGLQMAWLTIVELCTNFKLTSHLSMHLVIHMHFQRHAYTFFVALFMQGAL